MRGRSSVNIVQIKHISTSIIYIIIYIIIVKDKMNNTKNTYFDK